MTNDEVHSAVVRWIKQITGKTTIQDHQSGKAPALPYCMVNFTGMVEVREHPSEVEYEGETEITARPIIEMEWRFSVHSYGPQPTDTLRPVVSAAKLAQVMEPMFPALVIHEISQIRNVPDWINNEWQPRAQMDIVLRGVTRDGHVIDVIEEYSFEFTRV